MDVSQCPHYKDESADSEAQLAVDDEKFPWTGRPFGLTDLRFLSTVRRPHVVGIAGLADAGKTTLLGMLFLMIYRGYSVIQGADFAGSFTLQGWENIARHLQHNTDGPIQFPPHTTQAGRLPGLLHLRFALNAGHSRDYLLCDAPGEWFAHWTDDSEAEDGAGARWIAAHADRLLIVADSEALTGPASGSARRSLEFLVRRIQSNFRRDGVALTWSKVDLPRPDDLVEKTQRQFRACFPEAPIFAVQVPEHEPSDDAPLQALLDLFRWTFSNTPGEMNIEWPAPVHSDDIFLSYRGSQ